MTPADLRRLQVLTCFPATAKELIRVAGLDAAAALITAWPGQTFPVPARIGGGTAAGRINWARLVEIVGEIHAAAIVRHWRGTDLYVPSCGFVQWAHIQDDIRAAYDQLTYDGYSHNEAVFELGIRYQIAGRSVERVLSRHDNKPRESRQVEMPF
ncbi:MAG: hypothetical protein LBE22_07650 [Azoarcus sp.]|jgi:hypothetical protein|nr:hypothetical protein [Azoarcus sp.]